MTQRSLHAVTKVYYRSMSDFATVSTHSGPFCTMWFRQFTQNVTQMGHTDKSHPHSTKHDTQPIAYLISNQNVPYRTRGGTCCPRVSTPKIRSLADSSMTSHITWRNPTISTIPTLLRPEHRSPPWSNHISMDGRPSLTKTQAKLNITKDGKTCTTLMTAWLSIINQVYTQILTYEAWLQYSSMHANVNTRERKRAHRINMVKGHMPCSPASCCSKSWMSSYWRFSKSSAPNGSDQKQATQANK
jgi:hypothetical protein